MGRRSALGGKVMVITGASAGIGEATALHAASAGMCVVVAARRADRLDELVQRCEARGGQALAVATDVSEPEQVRRLVAQAVARFGRLDVMLANAGMGHFAPLLEMDAETESRMWQVNYHGSIDCLRAAAEVMRTQRDEGQGRGHLMMTSSVVGRIGLPYYGTYAATKAAQHAAAASLALELEPEGIRVTCIYPGGTDTEFFAVVAADAGADAIKKNTPRLFVQSPEQVARRIIRCVSRPKPELWPSGLTRLGMVLWTLSPALYTLCFRRHATKCREELERMKQGEMQVEK